MSSKLAKVAAKSSEVAGFHAQLALAPIPRQFTWVTPPPQNIQVFAEINADGIAKPESIKTAGEFKILSRTEKLSRSKPIWNILGLLKIKPEGATSINVLLDPAAIL